MSEIPSRRGLRMSEQVEIPSRRGLRMSEQVENTFQERFEKNR